MCFQMRIRAVYQLTAVPVIPHIPDHGGVEVKGGPIRDYPIGTVIAEGDDGHWYVHVMHHRNAVEAAEHNVNFSANLTWPRIVFRDYWRWITGPEPNKRAPYYNAILTAPRRQLKLRQE